MTISSSKLAASRRWRGLSWMYGLTTVSRAMTIPPSITSWCWCERRNGVRTRTWQTRYSATSSARWRCAVLFWVLQASLMVISPRTPRWKPWTSGCAVGQFLFIAIKVLTCIHDSCSGCIGHSSSDTRRSPWHWPGMACVSGSGPSKSWKEIKCRNSWQWPIQRCGSALSRSTRVEIRAATPKTSYQWHRDLAQPQWLTHRGPDQLVAAAGARGCGIIQTPTGLSPVACCGCAQNSRRVSVTKTHKLRFTLAPPQTSSPGVKRVSVVFAGKAPTCSKMSFAWDKGRDHSWYTYTLLFLYFYGFTYVTFLANSFVFRFEAFSCLNISPSPSLPFWLQRASAARTPMHMLLWLT